MDSYISWLVAGVIMIALELVLPGAILGILGYCAMMWGVYGLMGKGMTAFYTVGGVTVVLGVFLLWFINRFPDTWIGRHFTLGQRSTTDQGYVSNEIQENLVGQMGIAHSPLRPAGVALIDGNYVDVITEGDFVKAGTEITVVQVVGGRNIVRPTNK